MIPQELLDLRHQMYAAHAAYLEAWTDYIGVRSAGMAVSLVDRTHAAAESCRTTGARLQAVLLRLLAYLAPLQADAERHADLERAKTIQRTVRRELALIEKALSIGCNAGLSEREAGQ